MDAQPTVTVKGLGNNQISLLPSTAQPFVNALDPTRGKTLYPMFRFAALLENHTDKAIIAYSIRWHWTSNHGVEGGGEDSIFDFSRFPSPSEVPAHGRVFVSKLGTFKGNALVINQPDAESETAKFFQSLTDLTIEFTAIAFEDGTTIGADSNGWPSRWKAYLEAERAVLQLASATPPDDLTSQLSAIVTATASEASAVLGAVSEDATYAQFFEAWRIATTYEQQYALRKAASALIVLHRIGDVGEVTTSKEAAYRLTTNKYPEIQIGGTN